MRRFRNIVIVSVVFILLAVIFYFTRQFKSFTQLEMNQPQKASITRGRILADDGVNIFLANDKGEKEDISLLLGHLYDGTEKAVFLVEGDTLSIIRGGKMKEIILEKPVFNLKAHKDTVTLSNNLHQMTFNEKGEILSEVEEPDGFMVFSAVHEKKKYTAYSSLKEEEGRVTSVLYLMEGDEVFFRHEIVDQIIVHLEFVGDELLVATNTNIYLFDGESIRSQVFVSDLTSVAATSERIYVLEKEKFSIYDHDFMLKDRQILTKEDLKVVTIKNKCYLYNKNEILQVDTNLLTPISVDGEIVKLLKYKDHLYIVYPNSIEYLH